MSKTKSADIRRSLVNCVYWSASSPVKAVAKQFGLTPQAVIFHVKSLMEDRVLRAESERRHRRYYLVEKFKQSWVFPREGLNEVTVWNQNIKTLLEDLTSDEDSLCHYGLTEMVNNAVDHSEGTEVAVGCQITSSSIVLTVQDNGIGIFHKIAQKLGLPDPRQSLLELSKGKFTTDQSRHSGEGVFFTSRAFDRFSLRSSNLLFTHTSRTDDWLVDLQDRSFTGTRVRMSLLMPSGRKLQEVFARFSSGPDEYAFAKTHVPLKLVALDDEYLMSRSSAKRVLSRVDRFREVLLDFNGINSVGQAFADEIFRVYAVQHPHIQLIAINANEQVTGMIRRAEAAAKENRGA